jgi:dTDP-4-dehydrorhamnose reductase
VNKILVTGASGQLGLTLKNLILNTNDQWVFTTKEKVDITDINSISTFFLQIKNSIFVSIAQHILMLRVQKVK